MVINSRFSFRALDFNLRVAKFSVGAGVCARENNSKKGDRTCNLGVVVLVITFPSLVKSQSRSWGILIPDTAQWRTKTIRKPLSR